MLLSLFILCISVQLIYLIGFSIGFSKAPSKVPPTSEPVSVVIAARNEVDNLKNLLPALEKQAHSDFEIVVVNDRSSDDTFAYLKEAVASSSRLKVVTVEDVPDHVNSKKYALTLGIKAAKNDLLLFTDADCLPQSENWISQMASLADKKDIVVGFSGYESKKGLLNYFIRFETLLTAIQYLGLALLRKPYMGVGRNLAYRKSLFLSNKGFNGYMSVVGGDDDLFVNKHATNKNTATALGAQFNTVSKAKVSWGEFFKQKLRHLSVGKHYKLTDKIILGAFSLSYLLSWVLLPILLVYHNELYVVIGSFLLRSLLLYLTFFLSTKKLGVSFNLWGLIFLELIYVFYYSYTGVVALFTKRVTWS